METNQVSIQYRSEGKKNRINPTLVLSLKPCF